MTLEFSGQLWLFGDDLNTDAMYPAFAMKLDPPEAAKHISSRFVPAGLTRCNRATSS
jgi:3-isopropylmalate/(R)-2-methylmalate dehydratase small subunit